MKITAPVDEKLEQAIEKLNKCAFCMGIYSGGLYAIVEAIPDQIEFDALKDTLTKLLNRVRNDAAHLYYGEEPK